MICITKLNIITFITILLLTSSSVLHGMNPEEENPERTGRPTHLRIDISLIKKDQFFENIPNTAKPENLWNENPEISKGRGRGRGRGKNF